VSCACGRACAESDYQGNPKTGPRAFCRTDEGHIGAAIRILPERYVELSLKLAKTSRQQERVSGGGHEPPVPVDLETEAFMRHVILVALSWEDQVRAAARLSEPPGRVRDSAALGRACLLLGGQDQDRTGYLPTLLSLEPEDKRRPVPGSKRLAELKPGCVIVIDSSGDAWENRARDGADAGLEFLDLNRRARGMLGLSLKRRRVPLRCDGDNCNSLTLVQREAAAGGWEAVVKCTACPQAYIGDDYLLLMGRWFDATMQAAKASLPSGTQARHARALAVLLLRPMP
jgi:hypothetical protein